MLAIEKHLQTEKTEKNCIIIISAFIEIQEEVFKKKK